MDPDPFTAEERARARRPPILTGREIRWLEDLAAFARQDGILMTNDPEEQARIIRHLRSTGQPCPCPDLDRMLQQDGKCRCGLFKAHQIDF